MARYKSCGAVLVAGVGNLFLGDDGFGPEVARRMLAGEPNYTAADPGRPDAGILPDGVRVVDYGIRGMHLPTTCWTGSTSSSSSMRCPGTSLREPSRVLRSRARDLGDGQFDAHGMDPVAVLASLRSLGGQATHDLRRRLPTR